MNDRYYEWLGDLDAIHIRFPERHFNALWWMVEGRPVEGWRESLCATYESVEVHASNFGIAVNGWNVASPAMRRLLEEQAPNLVQFLPFRLQRPDGSGEIHGYCVTQVLRLIECLDRERTKVRNNRWESINDWGDFPTLRPIFVKRSLIGEERLFRIKGMCHSLVIREDLKDAIEQAGFPGQRFDLLECN